MATRVSADQARETAEAAREQEWKLPSFGKELFLGHLRLDLIYPRPIDTEARRRGEAFLAKFGDFLAREVDPGEIKREAKIPDRVIDGLKSIGALGMKIEEHYGGLGLSQLYYSRALSLSGNYPTQRSPPPFSPPTSHSIGVPEPLRLFGTEEQKEKWLPLVARTHLSAFMLTEPDAGSDPGAAHDDGPSDRWRSGYVVDGTKLWGTNGTVADVMVVLATVPPSEGHRGGITAFIIPTDSPGVTIKHRNSFMGLRGIKNSETRFADVFVPSENVIGQEQRPEDRPHHAQHRPSVGTGHGHGHREMGDEGCPAVREQACAVGRAGWDGTMQSPSGSLSSLRLPSVSNRSWT